MNPKNTICLWFDNSAHEAARFYAATFPDSKVTAIHKAPGDYPGGKAGDELMVEFTVVGIPCIGINGPGRDGPILERDRRQWRPGKAVCSRSSLWPRSSDG